MKYNIAVGLSILIGLTLSVIYGMIVGAVVNLALFLIIEKFLKKD
jgi:hypothetical protein